MYVYMHMYIYIYIEIAFIQDAPMPLNSPCFFRDGKPSNGKKPSVVHVWIYPPGPRMQSWQIRDPKPKNVVILVVTGILTGG